MPTFNALRFGPDQLSSAFGPLYRGNQEITLRPKPLAVLWHLASQAGEVVSKEALLATAWPRRIVSEGGLTVCIVEIRRALGDDARKPQYIQTVHGHGYRFIGELCDDKPERQATGSELLVGRELELQQLDSYFGLAAGGQRQLLFISGEAGIGKTALIGAWIKRLRQSSQLRLGSGQCIEHSGAGEAYLPLLEALSGLCRGARGAGAVAMLRQNAPSWLMQLPALLDEAEREALQQQLSSANAERMQRELADVLEALSVEQPLVLVLEDLHWSDPSTVEALSLLARRPQSARLLLVASYRAVEVIVREHPLKAAKQELQVHQQCQEIALGYLDESAVAAYLEQRFAIPSASAVAVDIHQRTEGHPLFMVALADYLAESGDLDGNLASKSALSDIKLPTGLQDFIELQLERLSDTEQQVLEAASIVGRTFATAALATALNIPEEAVEQTCESLGRRGLFVADKGLTTWPDGTLSGSYVFGHALYPEVLYGRIGSARRAQLHRRIGERLEQGFADQTTSVAVTLAEHFERGHDPNRALQYLHQAADIARSRYANREVAQLLRRSLTLLESQPASAGLECRELEMQLALGPVLIALEGYAAPAVKDTFDRALALSQTQQNTAQQFPVLRGLAGFYVMRADYETARDLGQKLLAMTQSADPPDSGQYLESHLMLGIAAYFSGEFVIAQDHLRKSTDLYDLQQHGSHALHYGIDSGALGLSMSAVSSWSLGYSEQALAEADQSLALAEAAAHPYSVAQCRNIVAYLHLLCGDVVQTLEHANATIALADEHEFSYLAAGAWVYHGWAQTRQGDLSEGLERIRKGLAIYQATGSTGALTTLFAMHAEACAFSGQVDEGSSVVADALSIAQTTRERFCEAELLRLNGVLLKQGVAANATAKAEASLQQALAVARQQQAKAWELRAATSLAELWASQGLLAKARELLAPAYGWFAEGFATGDLKQAKRVLDGL